MKIFSKILLITLACFFLYGCPEEDNQPDGNSTFKGYVYYSTGSKIYRINMKTLQTQSLFENASFPDTKENGKLLVCENYPKHKLIFTDLTGANRVKIELLLLVNLYVNIELMNFRSLSMSLETK